MTGVEFAQYIRLKTRTNTATLSDVDICLLANVRMETLSRGVMGADEDTLVIPLTTNLLVDDNGDGVREYPFPVSILSRIKYVEAKLNGTDWVPLKEFDLNFDRRSTDETTILNYYSNDAGYAKYDIDRKSLWIYSGTITAVTGGLKLWCNTYPAKLTPDKLADSETDLSEDPTTTTHGFPRELHELWARGVVIDYKESQEKPIPLGQSELAFNVDYTQAVQDLKHGNADREVFASVPMTQNGFNY